MQSWFGENKDKCEVGKLKVRRKNALCVSKIVTNVKRNEVIENNHLISFSSELYLINSLKYLSMWMISILFLLMPLLSLSQSSNNPFLKLKFDRVVMYDFEGGKGADISIINENGQLAKSVKKQRLLDNATVKKLNDKLGEKKSFGGTTAFCFDPHVGFVYYLKGKVVAHISICLDCNRLRSNIDIPVQKQGKVGDGDESYYLADGLSKSFRQFINALLEKNQFSHQIKQGSAFDE
jgi:hypothetical protein